MALFSMRSIAGRWRRLALMIAALAILLIGGVAKYFQWWDRYIETGLGEWAVAEMSERTRGIYTLQLGDLDFRPLSGSLSFDSAVVVTDSALNLSRGYPLPMLSARATGCRISNVSVVGLMIFKRFEAGAMGCQVVVTSVELAPPTRRAPSAPPAPPAPPADNPEPSQPPRDSVTTGPRRIMQPPLGIRKFEISNIAFPTMQFRLRRTRSRGEASFEIAHAHFMGNRVDFDPTAMPGTPEAFVSVGLRLGASNLLLKPDPLSAFSLGGIEIGLSDSTLSLRELALGPTITDEEWSRHQKTRHDRIRFALDSLAAEGIQYRTLVRTGEVHVRRVLLRGAELDMLSDKRLPAGPKSAHATPQRAAKAVAPAIRIDTIVVDRSSVSYLEHKPKRERPGRLEFASLAGRISNVYLPSSGQPLVMELSTRLMREGAMSIRAMVPLDAADFRFTLAGRLDDMPASALNRFLAETEPVRLKGGQIDSLIFVMKSTSGISKTTLTPYYRDLGIDFVSKGGVRGFVKAGVIEFGANTFGVRSDNPDGAKPPRTATISRRYESTQSWPAFLWLGIRDGLMKTVVK